LQFDHFLEAQAPVYATALSELRAGRKRSHWMWFIFPQIAGLGHSAMAQRYALGGLEDARAYLAHPVLGPRLRAVTEAVLVHRDDTLAAIFGAPDDLKFISSMTLFHRAAPEESLFCQALVSVAGGREDSASRARL
jgi:uncharacterized protein (DUF1810 family)